ncbi:apolipoprotein N-acyltransferase [Puniceicoccaceae bacterium K14]|nr:apolipoprotein N-acyltransferase [Puniceicoccaceae bacterium K14]
MWVTALSEFFSRRQIELSFVISWVLTGFLYVVAFPPYNAPEAAFVFLAPFFLWLRRHPSLKVVGIGSFVVFWFGWIVLVFWLRHVTLLGTFLLAGFVAAHLSIFCVGAAWLAKRSLKQGPWMGCVFAVGVAVLWVVLEHVRSWVFTGFPWLPLAATQWDRPIMLQSASFVGAWGVSFVLVLLNAGIASYAVRIYEFAKSKKKTFCPEFYFSLIIFVGATFMMARQTTGQNREALMRAAVLQPVIPQDQKWDEAFATDILHRLFRNSVLLKPMKADVLFWPEASIPYPLKGDPIIRQWAEGLADQMEIPIVAGALGIELEAGEDETDLFSNSVFLVRPKWGLHPTYYSKRHLVPFGEYIPLRDFWPWMTKVVPLSGDFLPGEKPVLIPLNLEEKTVNVGSLICYEDIFPNLARSMVLEGAGMFFVASNSAWYGQEGAAAQHMAHSVLRAVETRRIIIRVGNDGWTGWIDEYGNVQDEFEMWEIGGTAWELSRDSRWIGRDTPYVKNGDWFVWLCYGLAGAIGIFAWMRFRSQSPL